MITLCHPWEEDGARLRRWGNETVQPVVHERSMEVRLPALGSTESILRHLLPMFLRIQLAKRSHKRNTVIIA